jgi:hypothetical protein
MTAIPSPTCEMVRAIQRRRKAGESRRGLFVEG